MRELNAEGIEQQQLPASDFNRDRDGSVPGSVAWLRRALVAVVCAVLGHVPAHVLIALVMCIAAALLVASSEDARAEVPRLVPDGQLESAGALGVAVDQSTADLYAAGFLSFNGVGIVSGRVNKFDGSGSLLKPPSPFGEASAGYSGAAVNPVNGDVYALEVFTNTIDILDPATGAPLPGSFPVEPTGGFLFAGVLPLSVVGIAPDSEGNVYVPIIAKNEVLEYSPTTGEVLKTFTGGSGAGALKGPTGVAIDPAGNLWVADAGNNRIEELSPTDEPIHGGVMPSEGVGSVAVDSHGDVFAVVDNGRDFCGLIGSPCSHLVEYDSAGAQVADLGAGMIGSSQFGPEQGSGRLREPVPDMVAVSDATGEVYVSEAVFEPSGAGTGQVWKYRAPVAPTLGHESAVEAGISTVKLGAIVSPGGASASYRFEYGRTTEYGKSVPFPEGDTGAGFSSRTVWAGVAGLAPGTTYHYRAVVTGAVGEPVFGEDQTFTTHAATRCGNETFRSGYSANLPDCRAYELVTPPNKGSAQPDKNEGGNRTGELKLWKTLTDNFAAVDGSRLAFQSEDVRPGSPSASRRYLATRASGGWSAQNVYPPTDYYGFKCPEFQSVVYSEDLSSSVLGVAAAGQPCGLDPELVPGEPRGVANSFVRDNTAGTYRLIDVTPEGVAPARSSVRGESADFSHLVFTEEAVLTPGAPAGGEDVYEWSAGRVALATVVNGAPVAGTYAGISADGSRVFFRAGGDLYARVGGSETVQLDASQAGGPGGGGTFLKASHDGSVVFFTADASARLTGDTVPGSATNLYRYDLHAPEGSRLTDLTPVAHAVAPALQGIGRDGSVAFFTDDASAALTADTQAGSGTNLYRYEAAAPAGLGLTDLTPAKPAEPAEVQSVLGVAEDGSSVYFTAKGILTSQRNQHGELPQPGQANIYLSRGAGIAFIAAGAEGFRVSPNGLFLLFESTGKLTSYDNTNPADGEPATELYLYDASASSLACASCNPSGAPPQAWSERSKGHPGGPDAEGGALEPARAPRQLSDSGQVFFDSAEALLPADTNGQAGCPSSSGFPSCTDVYEFEPAGAGRCVEPAGCLSLLSTGTGALETFFIDASPSGNDVFIREFQKLLPSDTQDEAPSLYDVRVNGGFPEPTSSPCTTADACRTAPPPQPAVFGAPASQTFSGAGNLTPPPPATPRALTNAQKLAKALATCKKHFPHNKRKRQACEKAAHQKYRAKKVNQTNRRAK